MATVTASLTLSSPDLTGDNLSLSTSSTLTKAGTVTGLDQTTGVSRKTFTTNSIQTLIAKGDYADDKAHKVYIRNTSSVATEHILVTIEAQLLGPEVDITFRVECSKVFLEDQNDALVARFRRFGDC